MLSVALKFKDGFPRFAEYGPHFHHLPTDEEWANVESICEVLKVFKVFRVKETLDKGAQSENTFIHDMVTKMKERFDKYWGGVPPCYGYSFSLDSISKMKVIEFSFPTIYSVLDAEKKH